MKSAHWFIRTAAYTTAIVLFALGCTQREKGSGKESLSGGVPEDNTASAAGVKELAGGKEVVSPKVEGGGKGGVTIHWFGQACYLLTTSGGFRALIDPIPDTIGYTLPSSLEVDVVTISHEHFDHVNVGLARGEPLVLRGLTPDKKGWEKHDTTIKGVRIRNVGTYHDESLGKERGVNSVFIYHLPGLTVAHLGDLGQRLTAEQLKAIGPVDVVMVPVGSVYTIDAAGATAVVEQLKPRRVILPMHYKTDVLNIPLKPLDPFLAGKKMVRRIKGNTLELTPATLPKAPEIVVLNYK